MDITDIVYHYTILCQNIDKDAGASKIVSSYLSPKELKEELFDLFNEYILNKIKCEEDDDQSL
jgi:CO dehydrogenase/acetyl-CoA synthase beta subunit